MHIIKNVDANYLCPQVATTIMAETMLLPHLCVTFPALLTYDIFF